MIEKFDRSELKKICLAETFNDPHLLWSYVSPGTIKKVNDFLKNLKATYPESPRIREAEIIKVFEGDLSNKRRRTKYLPILLKESFEKGFISGNVYNELRGKLIGIQEYDENTRKAIEQRWKNEYANDGIYSLLEGKNEEPKLAA